MRYLSNHLTGFDEISMAMHISRSDPISDQKFENLKIIQDYSVLTAANLKSRKK